MIRIICYEADAGMAANVGGPVHVTYQTFDIQHPELEAWLRQDGGFVKRGCRGIELLVKEPTDA